MAINSPEIFSFVTIILLFLLSVRYRMWFVPALLSVTGCFAVVPAH